MAAIFENLTNKYFTRISEQCKEDSDSIISQSKSVATEEEPTNTFALSQLLNCASVEQSKQQVASKD